MIYDSATALLLRVTSNDYKFVAALRSLVIDDELLAVPVVSAVFLADGFADEKKLVILIVVF